MATRTPSLSSISSSSSAATELESASRVRGVSEVSRDTISQQRGRSPTNTIDGTSIAETTTMRSNSPTASHTSAAISVAATTNTAVTNASSTSQQQITRGIPIIRPPVLQQTAGTNFVGPQRPIGYPTKQVVSPNTSAIRIDVAAAHQQYQQRAGQLEMSSYSGSTTSSSVGSLSSPGTASIQQQQQQQQQQTAYQQGPSPNPQTRSDAGRPNYNQSGANGQAQFPNAIPAHQIYNELLGPDAFKDVILDIDYGALGNVNAVFQSVGDYSGGQLPPGINVRPAYTTMDSLNYQQHMFNTARTVYPGSENNNYNFAGATNDYNYDGGQHFDAAKAIFNQVDANHDGMISRDEFHQWAQGGQQNYSTNYQNTTTNNYDSAAHPNSHSFHHASLFDGANPAVATILQQSGLGQVVPH